MKNIEENLARDITKNPNETFRVLVVFEKEKDVILLKDEVINRLMPNIFGCELSADKILQLSQNKAIVSIERDSEVHL